MDLTNLGDFSDLRKWQITQVSDIVRLFSLRHSRVYKYYKLICLFLTISLVPSKILPAMNNGMRSTILFTFLKQSLDLKPISREESF